MKAYLIFGLLLIALGIVGLVAGGITYTKEKDTADLGPVGSITVEPLRGRRRVTPVVPSVDHQCGETQVLGLRYARADFVVRRVERLGEKEARAISVQRDRHPVGVAEGLGRLLEVGEPV